MSHLSVIISKWNVWVREALELCRVTESNSFLLMSKPVSLKRYREMNTIIPKDLAEVFGGVKIIY